MSLSRCHPWLSIAQWFVFKFVPKLDLTPWPEILFLHCNSTKDDQKTSPPPAWKQTLPLAWQALSWALDHHYNGYGGCKFDTIGLRRGHAFNLGMYPGHRLQRKNLYLMQDGDRKIIHTTKINPNTTNDLMQTQIKLISDHSFYVSRMWVLHGSSWFYMEWFLGHVWWQVESLQRLVVGSGA